MTTQARWFNGIHCVGIVRIIDPHDGVKYYIGVVDGHNEQDDIDQIAAWGTRFPTAAGDLLFGYS